MHSVVKHLRSVTVKKSIGKLGAIGALVFSTVAMAAEDLQPYQALAKAILAELVEINTSDSVGDNTAAAQAMADRLLAAGFPAEDVQVLSPAPRKGNLVARYRGKGLGLKPLLLLAHIDVVEADPADWTLAPFTFNEEGDYYIGRGVSDNKDEAAIHIANFIRLKQEGFVPDRDVVIALTADEEGGSYNGVQWLLAEHPDLIDAEYALNEGGGGNINDAGVYVSNTVQASEKVYQSYVLEVTNPGGHSSVPERDNAIYSLVDALAKVRSYEFPIVLNQITRLYFERRAELEGGELAAALRGVLQTPPEQVAVDYFYDKSFYNSRLRTTCVATMLEAGHAENALPQRARATVNCRVLPDESIEGVRLTLMNVIGDAGVSVTPIAPATQSPVSPLTPPLLAIIEKITDELWPGVPVLPTMSTGATDSLYLRNAGIPVYGVSGIFSDGTSRAHGQNERILISSFFEGQEFLYRLTKQLAVATDGG
ncbi:MAG: acetylornithine deacetylase/succinyl-diaminopimelate desuccinylase-like protein [Pseudohongiellaceae bacterium]|jgi:acetylornithine deacetylase/succinyl-diaminopimelate desuccinylase-like protein